ncbi:hypothetical protein COBT_000586 [Conglomerata obtusa]
MNSFFINLLLFILFTQQSSRPNFLNPSYGSPFSSMFSVPGILNETFANNKSFMDATLWNMQRAQNLQSLNDQNDVFDNPVLDRPMGDFMAPPLLEKSFEGPNMSLKTFSSSSAAFNYTTNDSNGNSFTIVRSTVNNKEKAQITFIKSEKPNVNSGMKINNPKRIKTILKKKNGVYEKTVYDQGETRSSSLTSADSIVIDKIIDEIVIETQKTKYLPKINPDQSIFDSFTNLDQLQILENEKKTRVNAILSKLIKYVD